VTAAAAEASSPSAPHGGGEDSAETARKALEQLGTRRVKALVLIAQARQLAEEADELLIVADLADAAPQATQRLEAAEAAREAAETALAGPQQAVAALQAELAEVTERAANIAGLIRDGDSLDDRIRARATKVALAEEAEAIRSRIRVIERDELAPLGQRLADAQHSEGLANREAANLVEAAASPFDHPTARKTAGYGVRIGRQWGEILMRGDTKDPDYRAARGCAMAALKASGLGAEIETRAIQELRAGNPAAVAVAGTTTHMPDGTVVVAEPGRPIVVGHSENTRTAIANMPGPAPVDTSPAAVLIAQAWAGVANHQRQPGLPGVHHQTAPVMPPGQSIGITK
jgi:hypothetical protein